MNTDGCMCSVSVAYEYYWCQREEIEEGLIKYGLFIRNNFTFSIKK